jgi:hypothetical protein
MREMDTERKIEVFHLSVKRREKRISNHGRTPYVDAENNEE